MTLWIPGRFPSLNETLAAAKSGRGRGNAYARLKKQWTEHVKARAGTERLAVPVRASFCWFTTDERTDADNVAAAKKYVLDGLVAAGVLAGDGRKHVVALADAFQVGAAPGVVVTLTPV